MEGLSGAENGIRTRDLDLGKVALYQLSYFRVIGLQIYCDFLNFQKKSNISEVNGRDSFG